MRPIAPAERRLQTDALNLAAAGVTDVPSRQEFAGEHAEGWYAVSWWVCEYIAATYGEAALWTLLDGLADEWRPADGGLRPAGDHHVRAGPGGHRPDARAPTGERAAEAGQYRFPVTPTPRLVHIVDDVPELAGVEELRMVVALDGFLDAGNAGAIACRHLVAEGGGDGGGGVVVATFDVDQLHDYRARRPPHVLRARPLRGLRRAAARGPVAARRGRHAVPPAARARARHPLGGVLPRRCSRSSSGSRCRW